MGAIHVDLPAGVRAALASQNYDEKGQVGIAVELECLKLQINHSVL